MIDFTRRDLFDKFAVLTELYSGNCEYLKTGAVPVRVQGSKGNRIFAAHPGQLQMINALFDGSKYIQMVCGVRWGKTYFQPSVFGFLQKQKNIWVVTPTYDLGYQNLQYILEILDKIPWIKGRWKYLKGDKSIVATDSSWGSRIKFKSAEHANSLDAEPVDMVDWDEAAKCKKSIKQKLLSRILEREGQFITKSTPVGHNFYYDMFEDSKWVSMQSSTYENPFISDSVINDLKGMMDRQAFKQDIMAQFVVFEGMVYYMFDPHIHLVKPGDIDLTGWEIIPVVDPGLNDPCAITWFAHDKINKQDIIIRSIRVTEAQAETPNINRLLNKHEPEYGYAAYVIDPYGGDIRNQQTRLSFKSWFLQQGRDAQGQAIHFNGVRAGKIQRIIAASARFMNVNNEVRLRILDVPETRTIIRAVENYHYPENSEIQALPIHDVNSHECDNIANYVAWRYRQTKTRSVAA